jgi:hypothetical protein
MDIAAKLMAIEEIKALKARYFRCMDNKDWKGLEDVFTPDVTTDFRDSTGQHNEAMLMQGAAPYVAMLSPILQPLVTVHHGHTPEINVISPIEAKGIWAMEDKLWAPEGTMPWKFLHGYGHYHETYDKNSGRWLIKSIRLSRLRVDMA